MTENNDLIKKLLLFFVAATSTAWVLFLIFEIMDIFL